MTPDIQELKQGLYKKLVPSGWGAVLKAFLLSQDMDVILNRLVHESDLGQKFTPRLKQVFRAFEECPYDKLKVVMILQDPYPYLSPTGIPVADGVPMSCKNTGKPEASLRFVWGAIKDTCYPGEEYRGPIDLAKWSNQGVLLLNAALTTTVGKTGVHYNLWKPFLIYLLDHLSWRVPGLVYLYLGKKAQEFASVTNDACYKLKCSHPASAGYQHLDKWDSEGVFKKCSEILIKDGKEPIKW